MIAEARQRVRECRDLYTCLSAIVAKRPFKSAIRGRLKVPGSVHQCYAGVDGADPGRRWVVCGSWKGHRPHE